MALFQLDHTVVYTIQFSCKRRLSNWRDYFDLFTPTALPYGNNTDLTACALHYRHAFLIPISYHLFAAVTAISLNRNPFRKCLFHIYFTLLFPKSKIVMIIQMIWLGNPMSKYYLLLYLTVHLKERGISIKRINNIRLKSRFSIKGVNPVKLC